MRIRRITAGTDNSKQRKIGDPPAIGNVAIASIDIEQIRNWRSGRPVKKKKYSTKLITWYSLLFLVIVSVILVFIVRSFRNDVLGYQSGDESEKFLDLDNAFDNSVKSDVPELNQEEAINIVTQALANRDPGLIQDFFIIGEGDNPTVAMDEFLRIRDAEGEITGMKWLGAKYPNVSNARQVIVHSTKDEIERTRRAQLARGTDGKWRIDLDAFLRKCDPPLASIAAAKSGKFMVRVFVAEEKSYRGMYSERDLWSAYSLTSPDFKDFLYAYAIHGSSQDKAMKHIMNSDENLRHATLEIIKQPYSDALQFEVSRVISDNWVSPGEIDFHDSF